MNEIKWNTEQCLLNGVLDRPKPKSSVPENFKGEEVKEYKWDEESLQKGLLKGGLTALMYYGCWDIWKTQNGFSGELMQYRKVTDTFHDQNLKFALKKAEEWAMGCQR